MTDVFSKDVRSMIMSRVRGKDTRPEVALRKALWASGQRFRKNHGVGRYTIDIAFPSAKVAVMVDGCFWHRCPNHFKMPSSNKKYWAPKIRRNMERDRAFTNELVKSGWRVIRFWEHEIKANLGDCLNEVTETNKT